MKFLSTVSPEIGLLCGRPFALLARPCSVATITVIGRDKTGVVARVTEFLFEQQANIEALEEQVTRGQFSMVIQASWKKNAKAPATLKRSLKTLGKELGMEVRLRITEPGSKQRMAIMVTREEGCPTALLEAFSKGSLSRLNRW